MKPQHDPSAARLCLTLRRADVKTSRHRRQRFVPTLPHHPPEPSGFRRDDRLRKLPYDDAGALYQIIIVASSPESTG